MEDGNGPERFEEVEQVELEENLFGFFLLDNFWAEILCPIGIGKSKEEKS